ncbi:MAG: 1-phosphofructokinase family hexose kinase [Sphingomonadaceae bacterium]
MTSTNGKRIATLTLNPAIDGACDAEKVRPTHKIRTTNEVFDPGGGGINVARVIQRLGGEVCALYMAGGMTGDVLDALLTRDGLPHHMLKIAGHTRVSLAVHERETGCEYRFVPEGPEVSEAEWRACLDVLEDWPCDYLVASGSLPRGVPDDFYVQVAKIMARRGIGFVVDTSGPELKAVLEYGGVLLVKPSLNEIEQLAGRPLREGTDLEDAAMGIVRAGQAKIVAATMGHEGALLATKEGTLRLPAIEVEVKSAVGAGDSFVAAMTYALANDWPVTDAFRLGLSAGTAAVLTPGTGLCLAEDVFRLYDGLKAEAAN